LRSGERIVVEDIEADPQFTPLRPIMSATSVRAVQSTPLIGRDGKLLGILSTHFRTKHRPTGQDLRLLDLYAEQASDFIERSRTNEQLRGSEQALRDSEARVKAIIDTAVDAILVIDENGVINSVNHAVQVLFGYTTSEIECQNAHAHAL
jgi:GAF domain-containing protein